MSSRVLPAQRLQDRVSAHPAASSAVLTSQGRYEACPSVSPDDRPRWCAAVAGASRTAPALSGLLKKLLYLRNWGHAHARRTYQVSFNSSPGAAGTSPCAA